MIEPLLQFRSRLKAQDQIALDKSRMLTSVICGFAKSHVIPLSAVPGRHDSNGKESGVDDGRSTTSSTITVISRLSSRRAGTRLNSRGIDDDGNVANFVETETIFWSSSGLCFSYLQIRGSVPLFWESLPTLMPGQQKIQVTRSAEATQPAFDKHLKQLTEAYGAIHIINLLSGSKPGEVELSDRYRHHLQRSPLRSSGGGGATVNNQGSGRPLLRLTEYDFHAETRAAGGYDGARAIQSYLQTSIDSFAYFLSAEVNEETEKDRETTRSRRPVVLLQQEGIFRVNCLDSLDRTNLVQSMISQMALETFLAHRSELAPADFWTRHATLWADNGDTLSKIYAGTGALKSSYTRHGKMSLSGALADARKSATRLYVNNFIDKSRQSTIDILLGRLMEQTPVELFDPINDYVTAEVSRRTSAFTTRETVRIWCGTFNLNGKTTGLSQDLSTWLCSSSFGRGRPDPEIMAVAFQEMVELSPQQIMAADTQRRAMWESRVKKTLNSASNRTSVDEYVLLRCGQLVGAALFVFVRSNVLDKIKNVEGAIKKTGMSGIAGNKGAVAVRLDYASSSLCFVTGHLAAGHDNFEERNRDYQTISQGLRFQRNRGIDDHDNVIWFGDLNYRISLSDDRTRRLIQQDDLGSLYASDQLHTQMILGAAFNDYTESRITFPPTYRFDVGTDNYDTSEKARIPAWCDRIVKRGVHLRQIDYDMAPLRFSDHRPVYGLFECSLKVIDESIKARLTKELYEKRKAEVGRQPVSAGLQPNSGRDDVATGGTSPKAAELAAARMGGMKQRKPLRSAESSPAPALPQRHPGATSADGYTKSSTAADMRMGTKEKPAPPPTRRAGNNAAVIAAVAAASVPSSDGVLQPQSVRSRVLDLQNQSPSPLLVSPLQSDSPGRSGVGTESASPSNDFSNDSKTVAIAPVKPRKPSNLVSSPSQSSPTSPPSASREAPVLQKTATNLVAQPRDLLTETNTVETQSGPAVKPVPPQGRTTGSSEFLSTTSPLTTPSAPAPPPRPSRMVSSEMPSHLTNGSTAGTNVSGIKSSSELSPTFVSVARNGDESSPTSYPSSSHPPPHPRMSSKSQTSRASQHAPKSRRQNASAEISQGQIWDSPGGRYEERVPSVNATNVDDREAKPAAMSMRTGSASLPNHSRPRPRPRPRPKPNLNGTHAQRITPSKFSSDFDNRTATKSQVTDEKDSDMAITKQKKEKESKSLIDADAEGESSGNNRNDGSLDDDNEDTNGNDATATATTTTSSTISVSASIPKSTVSAPAPAPVSATLLSQNQQNSSQSTGSDQLLPLEMELDKKWKPLEPVVKKKKEERKKVVGI